MALWRRSIPSWITQLTRGRVAVAQHACPVAAISLRRAIDPELSCVITGEGDGSSQCGVVAAFGGLLEGHHAWPGTVQCPLCMRVEGDDSVHIHAASCAVQHLSVFTAILAAPKGKAKRQLDCGGVVTTILAACMRLAAAHGHEDLAACRFQA